MASASASVDSKAELTALLEQWEREQQGSTQELVNILTKSVVTPSWFAEKLVSHAVFCRV